MKWIKLRDARRVSQFFVAVLMHGIEKINEDNLRKQVKFYLHVKNNCDKIFIGIELPVWRNWQTHMTQNHAEWSVPVRVRPPAWETLYLEISRYSVFYLGCVEDFANWGFYRHLYINFLLLLRSLRAGSLGVVLVKVAGSLDIDAGRIPKSHNPLILSRN